MHPHDIEQAFFNLVSKEIANNLAKAQADIEQSISESTSSNTIDDRISNAPAYRKGTPASSESYSRPTQSSRPHFFNTHSANPTHYIAQLLPIMLRWSEEAFDNDLKAQTLCLLARADLHLSHYDPNYSHSFSPTAVSIALAMAYKKNDPITSATRAHVYWTIADFLKEIKNRDAIASVLYEQAKEIFKLKSNDNHKHYTKPMLINRFLKEAEAAEAADTSTIKKKSLTALFEDTVQTFLDQPYFAYTADFTSEPQEKKFILKFDLENATKIFNPKSNSGQPSQMSELLRLSAQETTQLSLNALRNHHSPQQAIEWATITRTVLVLAKFVGIDTWAAAYAYGLKEIAREIHNSISTTQKNLIVGALSAQRLK